MHADKGYSVEYKVFWGEGRTLICPPNQPLTIYVFFCARTRGSRTYQNAARGTLNTTPLIVAGGYSAVSRFVAYHLLDVTRTPLRILKCCIVQTAQKWKVRDVKSFLIFLHKPGRELSSPVSFCSFSVFSMFFSSPQVVGRTTRHTTKLSMRGCRRTMRAIRQRIACNSARISFFFFFPFCGVFLNHGCVGFKLRITPYTHLWCGRSHSFILFMLCRPYFVPAYLSRPLFRGAGGGRGVS